MTAYDWGFRLSKRDRGEVDRMTREIERLQAALAQAHGEVGDSDTFDVELIDGELRILVNGMTSDTAIVPQSNNTLRIRKIPRRHRG